MQLVAIEYKTKLPRWYSKPSTPIVPGQEINSSPKKYQNYYLFEGIPPGICYKKGHVS